MLWREAGAKRIVCIRAVSWGSGWGNEGAIATFICGALVPGMALGCRIALLALEMALNMLRIELWYMETKVI